MQLGFIQCRADVASSRIVPYLSFVPLPWGNAKIKQFVGFNRTGPCSSFKLVTLMSKVLVFLTMLKPFFVIGPEYTEPVE